MKHTDFDGLVAEIIAKKEKEGRVLVAIDGRCASGKSTLATALAERLGAVLFHVDDFFLPMERRTEERLIEAGGNFDRERLLSEVIIPASRGETVEYRRYDCAENKILPAVPVPAADITLIEGAYSHHPALARYMSLKAFSDVSPAVQRARILKRNGDRATAYFDRWIPLEERYFDTFDIRTSADIVIENK